MSAREIVRLMNEEEFVVLNALKEAEAPLAIAAERVAEAFQKGGRTIYVGSGTSGRVAVMDAAEMPPTFGVDPSSFQALVSGGSGAQAVAKEDAEDDEYEAIKALNEMALTPIDIVIGITASGRTPFVVSAVRHARQKGLWTCGIVNNRDTPLFHAADLGILLNTGAEVLTGSTRLKAGTAQKLALNRISTSAMVLSGKVLSNLMVDVKAKNAKLKDRCARIVHDLTTATVDEAWDMLEKNGWNVRRVVALLNEAEAVQKA
jgi:N-acetylmuramic acid 6-phosphate etherase